MKLWLGLIVVLVSSFAYAQETELSKAMHANLERAVTIAVMTNTAQTSGEARARAIEALKLVRECNTELPLPESYYCYKGHDCVAQGIADIYFLMFRYNVSVNDINATPEELEAFKAFELLLLFRGCEKIHSYSICGSMFIPRILEHLQKAGYLVPEDIGSNQEELQWPSMVIEE